MRGGWYLIYTPTRFVAADSCKPSRRVCVLCLVTIFRGKHMKRQGQDEITNSADIIDSRDIIARIKWLDIELEDAWEDEGNSERITQEDWIKAAADDDAHTMQDAAHEFLELSSLQEAAEGYADDWKYGAQLIRDSYFVKVMQELCQDIGDLPKDIPGYLVIDWEATAENLKADYTAVDFDGVDYWVR